jgi:hypothetical protein
MVELTVFIVDDDRGVRKSIAELLLSVELAVETFESAQSFLDTFDRVRGSHASWGSATGPSSCIEATYSRSSASLPSLSSCD